MKVAKVILFAPSVRVMHELGLRQKQTVQKVLYFVAQVHRQLGLGLDVQLDRADSAEIRTENVIDGE